MTENLRFPIGKYVNNKDQWANLKDKNTDPAYCWYNDDIDNKIKYGAIYNWAAAQNACPTGWHLPTKKDFEILKSIFGDDERTTYNALINIGNNGFNATLGGWRGSTTGNFDFKDSSGYFWCSSNISDSDFFVFGIYKSLKKSSLMNTSPSSGYSIRCIKDEN